MGIHMAQEKKKGGILLRQAIQLGNRHRVEILGFGTPALVPATPSGVLLICVKST